MMEYKNAYYGDAYCVKCKDKVEFQGDIRVSDSGRRMAFGKCPHCGTKVNRILGATPNAPKPELVTPQPAVVPKPEPYATIETGRIGRTWTAYVRNNKNGQKEIFLASTRSRAIKKAMRWINAYEVIKLYKECD